jgi:hydrogenase nickel incorporation protein HypA/HybF
LHEYSIVRALIDRVEEEARAQGAVSVQRIQVRIGELAGVEPDLLASAYSTFRERTVCERAELDVRPVEARWVCPGCERKISRGGVLRCEPCGLPAKLAEGDEIMLDRIVMEVS